MTHRIKIVVEVELERVQGKFAGRDEMTEALIDEINMAEPSTIDGLGVDGDSSYEITSWEVSEL